MIGNKETQTLRAAASIIEQLGWLVKEHPQVKLDELGSELRKSLERFEPILLPNDVERSQLVQVLFFQLNSWKKELKRNFKSPIASFAEEQEITLLKAATLKKKDDPISIIVANAFDEKIKLIPLKQAVNALQEKGFVVAMKEQPVKNTKKTKTISDDPIDIILNA